MLLHFLFKLVRRRFVKNRNMTLLYECLLVLYQYKTFFERHTKSIYILYIIYIYVYILYYIYIYIYMYISKTLKGKMSQHPQIIYPTCTKSILQNFTIFHQLFITFHNLAPCQIITTVVQTGATLKIYYFLKTNFFLHSLTIIIRSSLLCF